MPKANSVPESRIAFKGAEAHDAPETKGSINLRIDARSRKLIDDAASTLGKTRTEFMIEAARERAIDALLDQRLFVLPSDQFDDLLDYLEKPAEPDEKLRRLMQREPPWSD